MRKVDRLPTSGKEGLPISDKWMTEPYLWGGGRSNLHLRKEVVPHMWTEENSPHP